MLLGPRQVGKTTLLRQLADDLLAAGWPPRNLTYFDFEDYRLKRDLEADEIVELRPAGSDASHPQIFLLDEVHHVARWDRWLKFAVDNRLGRIVATDSAASLLREAGRESGQGRWDEILLEGLTFQEFLGFRSAREAESSGRSSPSEEVAVDLEELERYLALGGFPAFAASDDYPLVRERLREDIVNRAIRRDLADRVDDPNPLRKLFVYLVQESGSEQNLSNRAADLGLDARTVGRWIELLNDTLLISTLPRGSASDKASSRLRGRSKLYASDHGLVTAFSAVHRASEVRGRVFETVVFRHLRELARERDGSVFYLRWKDQLEVDFLLEIGSERLAIEVTQSLEATPRKRTRLQLAAERAGASRAVLIHGGPGEGEHGGVHVVSLGTFLRSPGSVLRGALS